MSELPIDSLMAWYDERTKELSADFASEAGRRLDRIRGAIHDIRLVLDEIANMKSTEEEDILRAALERFVEKTSSSVEGITFPKDLNYVTVGEFIDKLEKTAAEIFNAGRRWIPRFRGRQYKAVIVDMDKHFRDLMKENQALNTIYKNHRHLAAVERVREAINQLNEMVDRAPTLKNEIKEQEKKRESARQLVTKNESRLKEYRKATGAHEKEEIGKEIEGIRQSLGSQLDLLRKAMLKFRESAEGGAIHAKPEHISTVDLYSRDLIEALNTESEGCPDLTSLLTEIENSIDSLGLEGSRQRRTLKRIDSLLKSDLLTSAQKRIKELLQRKGELSQSYQPGEEQRLLGDLEESKKRFRDEETKTYRLNEELDQLTSKVKQQSKEISSEIAKLTGSKIHISLTS
nr:hypothetical protein [Candidatus Njordarchaeum guaymaensis]